MLDWQVSGEGEAFPEAQADGDAAAPRRRGERRAWLWALLALAVVAAVTVGVARWRVAERQRAMRADLETFVRFEEQQRLFGLKDNVGALVPRGVPAEWKAAYLRTFADPDEARPVDVAVEAVAWEGERGARVTVRVDGQPQLRFYRLQGQRWRRAPLDLGAWGGEEELRVDAQHALRFREADAAFAEGLARDLPVLLARVARWPRGSGDEADEPQTITVRPEEFGPTIARSREPLALNSPQLVVPPRGISPEGAARFALAERLLRGAGPDMTDSPLFSARRMVQAARIVTAMRWALSPEEQDVLRGLWRERLALSPWRTPFFSTTDVRRGDPWQPGQAEAEALLTVDYLWERHGVEGLGALLDGMVGAVSWDALLADLWEQSALVLGREAEGYARGGLDAATAASQQPLPAPTLAMPLETQDFEPTENNPFDFEVQLPGRSAPVRVHTTGTDIVGEDGAALNAACLAADATFRIEGDWVQPDEELVATRITLSAVQPPPPIDFDAAPPDALAFGMVYAPPTDSALRADQTLVAVQGDGTIAELAPLEPYTSALPILGGGGRPPLVLLQRTLPECGFSWLAILNAASGEITPWSPFAGSAQSWVNSAMWREATQDILIIFYENSGTGRMRLASLRPNAPSPLTFLGDFLAPLQVVGWDAAGGRFLTVNYQASAPHLTWIAPTFDGVVTVDAGPAPGNFGWGALTADGQRLIYMTPSQVLSSDTNLEVRAHGGNVRLRDLATGEDTLLWDAIERGQPALSFVPLPAADGAVLVAAGNFETRGRIDDSVQSWWLVHPDQPDAPLPIAQAGEGITLDWTATGCASGGLLYTLMRGEQQEYHRWPTPADAPPLVTVPEDTSLYLWECR